MMFKILGSLRTWIGVFALFQGFFSQAVAIDTASNPAAETSDGTPSPNLAATQEAIEMRYRRFEDSLVQLREYLRKTDPSRAELLARATGKSNEDQIRKRLKDLSELLKKDQLSDAAEQQESVIAELQSMLELLMSEARKDELDLKKRLIQDAIKEVSKLIGKETDARAETERGGNSGDLQKRQKQVSDSTKKLSDKLEAHDEAKKSSKNDQGSNPTNNENKDKPKSDDGSPDEKQSPDPKKSESGDDENQTEDEKKNGKSAPGSEKQGTEKKPAADKSPQEEKSSKPRDEKQKDNSNEKDAEQKPGDEESKPGDSSKSGESEKSDSKQGKPQQSKPQQGKPQPSKPKKGRPQQGQPPENPDQQQSPQDDQNQENSEDESEEDSNAPPQKSDKTPGRDELKRAQLEMERAIEELKKNNNKGASDKQDKAIAELLKAKEKLEEILRLLREEERELVLVQMEARFRDMLLKQEGIYNATLAVHAVPVDNRTDRHRNRSVELARNEEEVSLLAAKALTLLKEEGSSVAFPEAVEQIRDDMLTIARRLERVDVGEITQNIESDTIESLKEIIESMQKELEKLKDKKQQQDPKQQKQQQQQQQQGLINKLAELKMLRSLQYRVNRRTKQLGRLVEGEQAVDMDVVSQLKQLSDRQAKVQKATHDLATGKTQ